MTGDQEIETLRREIERVDREILERVAERVRLAQRIGEAKRDGRRGALDTGREAAVIRRAAETARDAGVDPEGVRQLYWTLIGLCRNVQMEE